jgi:hypothetical protein
MSSSKFVLVLAIAVSMNGCTASAGQGAVAQASATAVVGPSGLIAEHDSSMLESDFAREVELAIAAVNVKYPPPAPPTRQAVLHRVTAVDAFGMLTIEGGAQFRIDGIRCTSEGASYLSRLVTADSAQISYEENITDSLVEIVWLADMSYLESGHLSPAYSLIADTVITSGWCEPERTATAKLFDRYVALAAIARRP